MKNILTIALLTSLLTGCGAEIAYKRGATARDLQAGKTACQQANSEQALNQCLEDNGWAVHKLDGFGISDDELFATINTTEDARTAAPQATSIKTTKDLHPEEKPKTNVTNKPEEAKLNDKNTPTQNSKTANTNKAKPQVSLLNNYVIKSWWKMGGNATQLEQNMSQCSEQLGKAHTPNKKTFTFTRGFAICMRQQGWHGLIEKHQ